MLGVFIRNVRLLWTKLIQVLAERILRYLELLCPITDGGYDGFDGLLVLVELPARQQPAGVVRVVVWVQGDALVQTPAQTAGHKLAGSQTEGDLTRNGFICRQLRPGENDLFCCIWF